MMPSEQFVGGYAAAHMEQEYGKRKIVPQLSEGVAVHFGDQALYVPGRGAKRLRQEVEKKIQELACAYAAWEYAVANPYERDELK